MNTSTLVTILIVSLALLVSVFFIYKLATGQSSIPLPKVFARSTNHLPHSLGMLKVGDDRFHVLITGTDGIWPITDTEFNVLRVTEVAFDPEPKEWTKLVKRVKEYFEEGDFYYSPKVGEAGAYDITRRVQDNDVKSGGKYDDYFVANSKMLALAAKDKEQQNKFHLVRAIKGNILMDFVDTCAIALITRHCPVRMGPRLQSRGTDKQGNASLTVENELVLASGPHITAYTIVRGSIPFEWSQKRSWLKPIPTPTFRKDVQRNANTIDRHVRILQQVYGKPVIGVSLVSFEGEEQPIGYMYKEAAKLVPAFKLVRYNYHRQVTMYDLKWGEEFLNMLLADIDRVSFFSTATGRRQTGVIRVNCLTTLDRTSVAQAQICLYLLEFMIIEAGVQSEETQQVLRMWVREAWALTADAISKQVGGTEAQQTDVIRHGSKTIGGAFDNNVVSVGRHWSSNARHDELFEVMRVVHGYSD
jgi:hypothetical protein